MTDLAQEQWIELSRDDFLAAIKRLRPERMGKRFLAKTLEIGFRGDEATFGIEGAVTRRAATGLWEGLVCVQFEYLNSFVRVRPPNEVVRLSFDGDRLCIGSSRFPATWTR
jgi:hypothetical protein